jgi:hypothetical protein
MFGFSMAVSILQIMVNLCILESQKKRACVLLDVDLSWNVRNWRIDLPNFGRYFRN